MLPPASPLVDPQSPVDPSESRSADSGATQDGPLVRSRFSLPSRQFACQLHVHSSSINDTSEGILDLETIRAFVMTRGIDFGTKVVAAIVLWIIGRWAINIIAGLLRKVLGRNERVDPTLAHYLSSILAAVLNLLLVLAILQVFGVQTTSFAALLAGLGLAIGTAWGGLLAHFAAGVFMQVLRPFKVGDFVTAGGVTGTVKELGIFGTTIISPDNVVNIVGNNKIFSDTISNYSATPVRRVELTAKIANGVDPVDAASRLREAIAKIPNVSLVHARRTAAGRAALYEQRVLLAGLLRHQPRDRRDLQECGLPYARNAVAHSPRGLVARRASLPEVASRKNGIALAGNAVFFALPLEKESRANLG